MDIVKRDWRSAIWRGFCKACPSCGLGLLFASYATTHHGCAHCGVEFHHHRADDAPPYFTMFIVGHLVIPALLVVEKTWHPELWIHFVIWLPLTLLLTLWILPKVKGAIIGLQWALRMHGFAGTS